MLRSHPTIATTLWGLFMLLLLRIVIHLAMSATIIAVRILLARDRALRVGTSLVTFVRAALQVDT